MGNRKAVIAECLKQPLPGILSHMKMLPEGRTLYMPESPSSAIQSGAMLLLFTMNEEVHICLIKRSSRLKYHPGQIGLPGGKVDKEDKNPLKAAIRETAEEIGVESHQYSIIGELTPVFISVSGFILHPFVGWCDRRPAFRLNTNEVDSLIGLPLKKLNPASFRDAEVSTTTGSMIVPAICYGQEVIWGATAMVLMEFYDLLHGCINLE